MRFLKVRGRAGVLVANPHVLDANPRRYAGQRQVITDPPMREHVDRYEPCDEVLRDEPSLRKAWRKGELEIIAEGESTSADKVAAWRKIEPPKKDEPPPEPDAAPSDKKTHAGRKAGKENG